MLPLVRVPTLVIHRSGDLCLNVEEGRFVADQIPASKFVELGGIDHLPFVGNQDEILDEIAGELNELAALSSSLHVITRVTLTGHSDDQGQGTSNLSLSVARAEAVRALLKKRGVDPDLLQVRGAGPLEPLEDPERVMIAFLVGLLHGTGTELNDPLDQRERFEAQAAQRGLTNNDNAGVTEYILKKAAEAQRDHAPMVASLE